MAQGQGGRLGFTGHSRDLRIAAPLGHLPRPHSLVPAPGTLHPAFELARAFLQPKGIWRSPRWPAPRRNSTQPLTRTRRTKQRRGRPLLSGRQPDGQGMTTGTDTPLLKGVPSLLKKHTPCRELQTQGHKSILFTTSYQRENECKSVAHCPSRKISKYG